MNSPVQAYFSITDAAVYTGYGYSTFRRKAKQYALPTCGDCRTMYSKEVLDTFMHDPTAYLHQKKTRTHRPKSGFTPVVV